MGELSDAQARARARKQYFLEHEDEIDSRRSNALGAASVAARRAANANSYLNVLDWSELDSFEFRVSLTRPLAAVLLSLIALKKAHGLHGSYGRLATMMGAFGFHASASTLRRAVAELKPLGLRVEPYWEFHSEGWLCRPDRKGDDETQRRVRKWREAANLYSVERGSLLDRAIQQFHARSLARSEARRSGSSRLLKTINLSGSVSPPEKQQQTPSPPATPVDKSIPHLVTTASPETESKERPLAANQSTARPSAAPEETAKTGEAEATPTTTKNVNATLPTSRPEASMVTKEGSPTHQSSKGTDARPGALALPPPEIVREMLALALTPDSPARAARLAELEAIGQSQAVFVQPPTYPEAQPRGIPSRKGAGDSKRSLWLARQHAKAQAECVADLDLRSRKRFQWTTPTHLTHPKPRRNR